LAVPTQTPRLGELEQEAWTVWSPSSGNIWGTEGPSRGAAPHLSGGLLWQLRYLLSDPSRVMRRARIETIEDRVLKKVVSPLDPSEAPPWVVLGRARRERTRLRRRTESRTGGEGTSSAGLPADRAQDRLERVTENISRQRDLRETRLRTASSAWSEGLVLPSPDEPSSGLTWHPKDRPPESNRQKAEPLLHLCR
jgi:hypothetical protein